MKKILALIMTIVLVAASVVIPANASDDVEISLTEKEAELLYTLGITFSADPEGLQPTKKLTRGVAAYYMANMVADTSGEISGFDAIYYDVTSEHAYYADIKVLKDAGVMRGYPDGRFGPDDYISTMDAALALSRIMGYSPYVKMKGLNSFILETDILDGVEVKDELQVQDLLKMIYNALHAPAMEIVGIDNQSVDFEISDDYLVLEHIYGVMWGHGIVDGIRNTRLMKPDSSISDGIITINTERYEYKKGDEDEFFGYNVDYYYKKLSSGKFEIIYMSKSNKNRELVLESDILEDYSDFTFTYADIQKNRYKTVDVPKDIDVIINGIANPAFSKADVMPDMGSVTFIDNNNDRTYDVIKVESYEFFVVKNVDANKKIIYDKEDGVKLDLGLTDEIKVVNNGKDYALENIVQGNFVIVKRTNPDSGFYYAEVDVRKDERTFTEIEKVDLKNNYLKGGGTEYKVSSNLPERTKELLKEGEWLTLYFCNGIVVRAEKSSDKGTTSYGYLMNMASDGVFDATVSFMVAKSDGTIGTYTLGKVIRIDETTYRSFDAMATKLLQTAQLSAYYEAGSYAQPIRYEVNEKGNIISIDTAYFDAEKEDAEESLRKEFSGKYVYEYSNLYDSGRTTHCASRTANTTAMKVPAFDKLDVDAYSSGGLAEGDTAIVEVFNLDDNLIAKAIFVYQEESEEQFSRRNVPVVVKSKNIVINDDGDILCTIVVLSQNQEVTYTGKQEVLGNVEEGDMIRLLTDKAGQVSRAEIVFDLSEDVPAKADRVKFFTVGKPADIPLVSGFKAVYTTVIAREGNLLRLTPSCISDDDFNPDYNADNVTVGNVPVYRYSNVRGTISVSTGSLNDIQTYKDSPDNPTEAIFYSNNSYLNFVYILER